MSSQWLLLPFSALGAEVSNVFFEVEKAVRTNRSRNVPKEVNEPTTGYMNLGVNFKLHRKVTWENKINTEITTRQFRYVSWDFKLGVDVTKDVNLYYRHHSGHVLDYSSADRFNEENSIGVRINFK